MPADQVLPSIVKLLELYDGGMSQPDIAARYGVSKQAVSKVMAPYMAQTNAKKVAALIPWQMVDGHHHKAYVAKCVKALMRRRLMDDTLTDAQMKWADRIARRLRDEVLDYDPATTEGWLFRAREETDGQLFFRWPADRDLPAPADLPLITLKSPEAEAEERDQVQDAIDRKKRDRE
ncbi:hypothetical protein [Streptomyces sp. ISL-11]|uniref:hypothetical protein n=1 Tax=Streptomyces sp. ISL-11 TaxID=2819174 RepID=UPI001BE575C2|nr:hypothetical protein [Streptomyces sp. ISL-11]MBT2383883.1 hypothetical protein [Streptomyces sp. ISL-11]